MNDTTPVGRITTLLEEAGYRSVSAPLVIGGLKFVFPAALVGTEPSPDLILIADTTFELEERLVVKLEGVARALDVARSKRPLTVVVAGPRPTSANLEAMARVCRVLPTGTVLDKDAEDSLRNWLAVLLPLRLPEAQAPIADAVEQFSKLGEGLDQEIADLVVPAKQGSRAVQVQLHKIIDAAVDDIKEDGTT
ncbi:hypothetical protein [Paralcaligenes ureilyticus]|uniref:Uncharacterized protein n=1 Tax=Paralcaligenes ureilyticus TaxID=627131 RepID=A0A4R3MBL6_9BURK|nr:hypothetical protein [Paralcaligenes ureilyticus]TCT11044.1 hypothetical protein EDC26_101272 [Paralcaligenes ureilyticus]